MTSKKYLCKWCNEYTDRARHHYYCDKNPNGKRHYEELCARNKRTYEKYCKKKILETSHRPAVTAKRSQTVKRLWKEGVYDEVNSPRFTGKSHTQEFKNYISKKLTEYWIKRRPLLIQENIKKHNTILPVLSSNYHNPYQNYQEKTVIGGEFFEEDFFDYYEE